MTDISEATAQRLEKSIDKLSDVVGAWPDKAEARFATKEAVALELEVRDGQIGGIDKRLLKQERNWFWLVTTIAAALISGLIGVAITYFATRGH